jgi:anti-repressor protein
MVGFFMGKEVRAFVRDGVTWIVAKDVGEILGIGNIRVAVGGLDPDERSVINSYTAAGTSNGKLLCITINAAHYLAARSNKPEGKALCKWLTGRGSELAWG